MSNIQNNQIERVSQMFKALSNPHRLHIFLRLISCCPPGTRCAWDSEAKRYVGELAEEVDIVPSTVSHHIKELRNAGLIKAVRQGKNIECWVDPDVVHTLAELLAGRFPAGLLPDEPSRKKEDFGDDRVPRHASTTEAHESGKDLDGAAAPQNINPQSLSCCSSQGDIPGLPERKDGGNDNSTNCIDGDGGK
jgi:ArsR family transcriptional regulator, arsenate/arsenite/antimonite-responsive transcriptional repressor